MSEGRKTAPGERETALLRYISERGEVTVGEAAEEFGAPHELSRSTVVTLMDRLRTKGQLSRAKGNDGVYRYASAQPKDEMLGGLVARFIERTLGGRLTALTAYFTRSERLSDEEKAELRRLLKKMEARDDSSE